MPRSLHPQTPESQKPSSQELWQPIEKILHDMPPLLSRGYRPLKMTFEQQLKSLILFHLEEHNSARHLLQVLKQDDFARSCIAPPEGIGRSSYGEALNTRGLEQLYFVYEKLQAQAALALPKTHAELGELVAIDGTLINAVSSMAWADYSSTRKKAKIHLGFDINRGIPGKICLTEGKGDEKPMVPQLLSPGQTGVMDRNYQCYHNFDLWQGNGLHFVCRIKAASIKTCLETYAVPEDGPVFYDALVRLGAPTAKQTQRPVRVVGYRVDGKAYWVATNRFDLPATDIALIYKLRWEIGASSKGRIIQSVKVRPRLKDSRPRSLEGAVARKQDGKALRQPSSKGGWATLQVVTCSERRRSLVTRIPVAETVDNVRRQQEMTGMSHIRFLSPAGYQRRHGAKDYAETGEALGARRRNLDEGFLPITVSGKWREWHQGGGSGRSTGDLCAAKRRGDLIKRLNTVLDGWVAYFRVGNSSRAFSTVRDYLEMKVRTFLTRRKLRKKRSVGWRRWSNEYLYGVLGLFWGWKIHPLPGTRAYS